ncbi:MAG: type IA DNA topoisomerase [Lachnospiraceae bacterium]|nr:type IA DNA topoisomerase [Lachnospiraceae bacterium]
MSKSVFIAEKPSVAKQFAQALKLKTRSYDGYLESENCIVTWCVGHLVTMSYPDVYDSKYKKWSFATLPFLPSEYKYEVIKSAEKQFRTVKSLLTRDDVETIYVCTDSGREGEYIYRLVARQANVKGKIEKRVWIDSQTEEAIRNGIRDAKDISEYDSIADSAYLRAKEDYLMGINFSRALTLKYGEAIAQFLGQKYSVVAVGRVMTCVLGMVVRREREIRSFVKTPFYRIFANCLVGDTEFKADWKAVEGSKYYMSPELYKDTGFLDEAKARDFTEELTQKAQGKGTLTDIGRKKEKKNPPYLYNLTELSADCSKFFKISPADTLNVAQELYEKKLTTYPRTNARVLSTAVAKEIGKNIKGLCSYRPVADIAKSVLDSGSYKDIAKTRYVNDKLIEDHYAIIPTGQGFDALSSLSDRSAKIYELIVRRFLCIFYPPAVYTNVRLTADIGDESFFAGFKVMDSEGYLGISKPSYWKDKSTSKEDADTEDADGSAEDSEIAVDADFLEKLKKLKKGSEVTVSSVGMKEGETSPPKRYTTGTMMLAMENAGQLIEDEELRAQIKGSGIGTSATRAGILEKLGKINYLKMNKKTQVITPAQLGEMVYDVVNVSIRALLDPKLTASWEKGLTMVANGELPADDYMTKLNDYVARRTNYVRDLRNQPVLKKMFQESSQYYKSTSKSSKK